MHLARKTRSSSSLLDSRDLAAVTVSDAQYGPCAAPVKHEIRLFQQAADVGTRVMPGHRMIGVAEQGFTILGADACRT